MALPLSYNVRNVLVRWKVTLFALAGISLVVAVLIALTAMSLTVKSRFAFLAFAGQIDPSAFFATAAPCDGSDGISA